MAVNYSALLAEIAKPDYSGMDDDAIAEAINAKTVTQFIDVPIEKAVGHLALADGALYKIEQFAKQALIGGDNPSDADKAHDAAVMASASLISVLGAVKVLETADDTKRGKMVAMLQALMAQTLIIQDDIDALVAMAQLTQPFGSTFGYSRPLDHGDIKNAKAFTP